jgi:hypothetical protein
MRFFLNKSRTRSHLWRRVVGNPAFAPHDKPRAGGLVRDIPLKPKQGLNGPPNLFLPVLEIRGNAKDGAPGDLRLKLHPTGAKWSVLEHSARLSLEPSLLLGWPRQGRQGPTRHCE